MIEVRTQSAFENIVYDTPNNQTIYIYPRRDGEPYSLSSVWYLTSNTSIIGVGKPKIVYTGDYPSLPPYEEEVEEGEVEEGEEYFFEPNGVIMASAYSVGSFYLSDIRIEGIHLIGGENIRNSTEHEDSQDSMLVGIGVGSVGADYYYSPTQSEDYDDSIYAYGSGICIKDCIIEYFQCGIGMSGSYHSNIHNNTFRNNSEFGVYVFWSGRFQISNNSFEYNVNGIGLLESSEAIMSRNIITNTTSSSFLLQLGVGIIIDNNTITNSGDNAIVLAYDNMYNCISNNKIINNHNMGIMVDEYSHYINIHNNSIMDNIGGESNTAIYMGNDTNEISSTHNVVTYNTIRNYDYGIHLQDSSKNIVVGNITSQNDTGIRLENSSDHVVYGNLSTSNTTINYEDVGGTNNKMGMDYNK